MRKRSIGITLQYLNTAVGMISGLFLSAFLLRVLGDTEYGLYQTISSFVNYLVLLEFGTGTVITRNISACRARNEEQDIQRNISTVWTITWALAFVIFVVGIVFYCLIGRIYRNTLSVEQIEYGKQIFLLMLLFLIISFFANTLNGVLMGFEKYKVQPIVSLVRVVFRTLSLVVLILCIRKSIVIAAVDLAISFFVDIFYVTYCHEKLHIHFSFRYFDYRIFRNSLPLALAIFIQVLVNQANNSVDKFVIGIKLGPEEVAVYSVGLFVYSIFSSMTTIPISMYEPQVVKEISDGLSPNEVSMHLIQPSRFIVLIGGTILFGFFAVGKQFISLVYGPEYILAWIVALIIMTPMMINMSNGIMINILDATDKRMARSGVLLVTTLANIILTVLWIDKYGILGACIATAVCTLLGQILLMDFYYSNKLQIKIIEFRWKTYKGIILFQLVASCMAYFIGLYIQNTFISFLVCGILYVAVFSILFLRFGASQYEKDSILKVKNKILRK